MGLFFSFYFDNSRKSLLAKVGCWHTIKNVNRLLGEHLVFTNDETRYQNICQESDIYSVKNRLHFTLSQHKILVHGQSAQVFE